MEFKRNIRGLDELKHFKATEIKYWILHIGPVLFRGMFADDTGLYSYFLTLSFAYRSLLETSENTEEADLLLNRFSRFTAEFGDKFMTYNMHSLRHLAWQVRNFGPLWTCSAFSFESANYMLSVAFTGNINHCVLCVERYLRKKMLSQNCIHDDAISDLTHILLGKRAPIHESHEMRETENVRHYRLCHRVYCRTRVGTM